MHELSIALSMIEQVEEEAAKCGNGDVEAVHVRLGVLSGVDIQAFRFAYDLAREGTRLATARLEIEIVPLLVYCPRCARTRTPAPHQIACPFCVTPEQQILQGKELEVRAFEIVA